MSLNTELSAIPDADRRIGVGLVPFGSSAALADVGGQDGNQSFVSPVADETERDRTADVVQSVTSMNVGQVVLFANRSVGSGTTFTPALTTALDALDERDGAKFIFMLSDGFGSLSSTVLDRIRTADATVRTFAVGAGSDRCATGGELSRIASASGSSCTYTENPSNLSSTINTAPSGIDRVTVSVDGNEPVRANIDAIGNFSADVFIGTKGAHSARATVFGTDGTTATTTVDFTVGGGTRYVALGDSYSAGEGIPDYANVPGNDRGCHQSETGYPTFVGSPGFEIPGLAGNDVDLDYVACSGAVMKDILTVRQNARGERHIVQISKVDASADLVTLTIGGNDVGFSEVLSHCATQFDCYEDGFARLNSGRDLSAEDFLFVRAAIIGPQLQGTYRVLRDITDNKATIVALDYPELIDDGLAVRLGCKEAAVFDRGEREWLNSKVRVL